MTPTLQAAQDIYAQIDVYQQKGVVYKLHAGWLISAPMGVYKPWSFSVEILQKGKFEAKFLPAGRVYKSNPRAFILDGHE